MVMDSTVRLSEVNLITCNRSFPLLSAYMQD